MSKNELMGYVRKLNNGYGSDNGKQLQISISVEAFEKAEKYHTRDDQAFVEMVVSIPKILELIDGQKEVTGVSQIKGE